MSDDRVIQMLSDARHRVAALVGAKRRIAEATLIEITAGLTIGLVQPEELCDFTGETFVRAALLLGIDGNEDEALPKLPQLMIEAVHRARCAAMHWMGEMWVYRDPDDYVPPCGRCGWQWCQDPGSAACKEREQHENDRWYEETP